MCVYGVRRVCGRRIALAEIEFRAARPGASSEDSGRAMAQAGDGGRRRDCMRRRAERTKMRARAEGMR